MLISKRFQTFGLVLGLFLALGVGNKAFSATQGSESLEHYWKESVLMDFDAYTYKVLTQENCTSSAQELVACLYAMNTWPLVSDSELITIDREHPENGVEVLSIPAKYQKSAQQYRETQWQKIYDELAKSQSDFLSQFNFQDQSLLKRRVDRALEKMDQNFLAATIYNAYLSVSRDPHTMILPTQFLNAQRAKASTKKGLGIKFVKLNIEGEKRYVIEKVLEDSPVEGKLKALDIILSINGESKLDKLYRELKQSDEVVVEVLRQGLRKSINVKREVYHSPNITLKNYRNGEGEQGLPVLKIKTFFANYGFCQDLYEEMEEVAQSQPKGLILDLRENTGGHISFAQCLLDTILPKGSYNWLSQDLSNEGEQRPLFRYSKNKSEPILGDLPLVILVNSQSASASEVVSQFLRDYGKAYIVGRKTFGKGTIQTGREERKSFGVQYSYTESYYISPLGRKVHLKGVTPDFVMPKNEHDGDEFREVDNYPIRFSKKEEVVEQKSLKNSFSQVSDCVEKKYESFLKSGPYLSLSYLEKQLFDKTKMVGALSVSCLQEYKPKMKAHSISPLPGVDYELLPDRYFW